MLPAVLVIVTVDIPVAAVLLAVSVKVLIALVGVVGFVLNDAVTPFGRPDAAKVTFPGSEEWGVGEEGRYRWEPYHLKKKAGDAERQEAGVPQAGFTPKR